MLQLPIDPDLILGHIQDGLLIVDTEGKILWANSVFLEMIGRTGEEVVGRSCCELGVGDFCSQFCPASSEGARSCKVDAHFNVQVKGREGKGNPGAYCFVSSPVRDSAGEIIGYMENFRGMDRVRDVIMQLEEVNEAISAERHKTEDLIDSMADGVFSVDQDLRVRRFSRNMEQMLGIAVSEAIGKPCREVLKGTLCDTDCPLVWSRKHGKPVTGCRERLLASDGRSITASITTGFLRNEPDFEQGLFGVVTDLSEVEKLREELEGRHSFEEIVGDSAAMRALFQQIEAVSPTDATVLVLGESGTGKELVARAIHRRSSRSSGPFVSVNCAALVDELLESELFGHVRGAFTGAVRDRQGRFEKAGGGTLLLDEVGDTSPALQAKLLRAIQEKTIEPVGSEASRKVDVRIIAATNKDLMDEVRKGHFREDLYYRLNVIPFYVPPLRDRRDDIPVLVEHFLQKYREVHFRDRKQDFEGVSERALALMMEYPWPGNVRELEHAIEYAMISSDSGRIERAFLPLPLRQMVPRFSPEEAVEATPREAPDGTDEGGVIREALERGQWNVGKTAAALGVSRTTLWRRMKRHGISKS
jgi:PAS domain S-box-containing protein